MARKTARETKLEASIKALLDGAVQNGTFNDVCLDGKKVLIDGQEFFGDDAGVFQLVRVAFVKCDRECLDRFRDHR